ncbi:MAG TPA: MFS transporter [Streptosporangiaceae bacterium]|jgi:sugar phosphate permease
MSHPTAEEQRADPGPSPARIRRIGLTTGVILMLAFSIDYVDRFAVSMVLPAIGKEFSLSATLQGSLVSAFAVVYMICQIPAGLVADKLGARMVMLTTLVLWSAFTLGTALATSFAVLIGIRALFGASQGFFPASVFKTISERTTPHNRGTVTGLMTSASGIGTGVTPLIMAPLLIAYGWRGSFMWLAGAGAVIGVVLWLVIPRKLPARLRDDQGGPAKPTPEARRAVLRSPQVWMLAAVFCAFNFVVYGLITWVPSYLQVGKGISIGQTGVLASIPLLVSFVTTILGGWLFDRYFQARPRPYLFVTTLVSGIFMIPMAFVGSAETFIVFETIASGIGGLGSMALVGLPMRVLPSSLTGTGMGVFNFGGQVAGLSAPLLLGVLVDNVSYGAAFGLLAVASLIAAGLALRMPARPDDFSFVRKGV